MTSVVLVDTGGTVCEAEAAYEEEQEIDEAEDYPAVIVEEVPGASLAEEHYSGQVVVYQDEAYLMQEVGDEQEVETEGEVSPGWDLKQ
uniref:Transcription factor Elf N-terminal domain-containing protein n=1 Tax=Labrus bergylta TaxID=56723 RepID=A0A3Q3FVW9_9LABR